MKLTMESNKKDISKKNISFYTDLYSGKEKRGLWGKDNRFSPDKIAIHPSVEKYLIPILKKYISNQDKVLDYGCGPGSFFSVIAPFCSELIGVDVVPAFIEAANEYAKKTGLNNVSAYSFEELERRVGPEYFDVILMIDVIHHVEEDIAEFISRAEYMLKPVASGGGGTISIGTKQTKPVAFYNVHV